MSEPPEVGSQPFDVPLVGGPQDGGLVVQYPGRVHPVIWVGPRWLGDGHVSFSTVGPYNRKPAEYRYDGRVYRHAATHPFDAAPG